MRRPGQKQRRFVYLLLAIIIFGVAYYAGNRYSEPEPPNISGILLRPATPVPSFALKDQNGEPFSEQQLQGHWSLLVLDPKPDIDSSAFLRLVQVHNRLAIDPDRQKQTRFIYLPSAYIQTEDSPPQGIEDSGNTLANQVMSRFNPDALLPVDGFILLHGEPDEVSDVFERFGVTIVSDIYTLYLIDPENNIQALFTETQDAATIAGDFNTLITHQ